MSRQNNEYDRGGAVMLFPIAVFALGIQEGADY